MRMIPSGQHGSTQQKPQSPVTLHPHATMFPHEMQQRSCAASPARFARVLEANEIMLAAPAAARGAARRTPSITRPTDGIERSDDHGDDLEAPDVVERHTKALALRDRAADRPVFRLRVQVQFDDAGLVNLLGACRKVAEHRATEGNPRDNPRPEHFTSSAGAKR
ncbi:MAG: hypothetical protein LC667_18245 [Thioalkalivibrio sp.]|nr:hypothetical protein [Thioalkalivibrio sp.]